VLVATNNFLFPNGTFIAEIIAFLIVVGVLAKWVLPVLNKAMVNRQEEIRSSLEAAERARAQVAEREGEQREIVAQARDEAHRIIAHASEIAEHLRAEGEANGRQAYEQMVSRAESEISLARQRAIDDLTDQVADLVMDAAERVIGEELDRRRHQALIDEAIAAIRAEA